MEGSGLESLLWLCLNLGLHEGMVEKKRREETEHLRQSRWLCLDPIVERDMEHLKLV